MFPSFLDKEFLLTNKISYRFNSPQRGDVIIFKAPKSEPCSEIECEYIKRLIGLPGDRIMVKQSLVYLNGEQLNETDYLGNSVITSPGSFLSEGVEKIVPEGYILPLGDNRPYSRDGREFGFVSRDSIIGKAWLRYWPIEKIGFVKHENYN